jgi:hypothetical protein
MMTAIKAVSIQAKQFCPITLVTLVANSRRQAKPARAHCHGQECWLTAAVGGAVGGNGADVDKVAVGLAVGAAFV